ncbi:MAG: hypothetical protein ACETVY_06570 [Candidatus Bathyarchaeia archaeon]
MNEKQRKPTLNDYLAGAVLTNGLVWIWLRLLGSLGGITSNAYLGILSLSTLVICLLSSTLASYQVCRRAQAEQLLVGMKAAGLAWLFSPFIIFPIIQGAFVNVAIILLVCFSLGGVAGAYLATKARLRRLREGAARHEKEDF